MGLGRQEAQHLFSIFILAGKGTVDAETFFIKIYILPHQATHFPDPHARQKHHVKHFLIPVMLYRL